VLAPDALPSSTWIYNLFQIVGPTPTAPQPPPSAPASAQAALGGPGRRSTAITHPFCVSSLIDSVTGLRMHVGSRFGIRVSPTLVAVCFNLHPNNDELLPS